MFVPKVKKTSVECNRQAQKIPKALCSVPNNEKKNFLYPLTFPFHGIITTFSLFVTQQSPLDIFCVAFFFLQMHFCFSHYFWCERQSVANVVSFCDR